MPRFYMCNLDQRGAELAYRLSKENHDVVIRYEESPYYDCLSGIVRRMVKGKPTKDDVVLMTRANYFMDELADDLRAMGMTVIGCTDGLKDENTIEQFNTLKIARFESPSDAISYITENDGRWEIKDMDKEYISQSALDAIDMINTLGFTNMQLTQYVDGPRVTLTGWFDGNTWIENSFYSAIESLGHMNHDLGLGVGGSVVWTHVGLPGMMFELHDKLSSLLGAKEYIGPVSFDLVFNDDKMYVNNIDSSLGAIHTSAWLSLWQGGFGDGLLSLAKDEMNYIPVHHNMIAINAILSIPPYPFDVYQDCEISPVHIKLEDQPYFWPRCVRLYNNKFLTIETCGEVGIMTAFGETVEQAQRELYDRFNRVVLLHKMYRTDIGNDAVHIWSQLIKYGYPIPESMGYLYPMVTPDAAIHQAP